MREKLFLLLDMEVATKAKASESNGYGPIDPTNLVVFRSLQQARDEEKVSKDWQVDYERHINGAPDDRNVVYDATHARRIMDRMAVFSLEDSERGDALRGLHITPEVIQKASDGLFEIPRQEPSQ